MTWLCTVLYHWTRCRPQLETSWNKKIHPLKEEAEDDIEDEALGADPEESTSVNPISGNSNALIIFSYLGLLNADFIILTSFISRYHSQWPDSSQMVDVRLVASGQIVARRWK